MERNNHRKERVENVQCSNPAAAVAKHFEESLRRANIPFRYDLNDSSSPVPTVQSSIEATNNQPPTTIPTPTPAAITTTTAALISTTSSAQPPTTLNFQQPIVAMPTRPFANYQIAPHSNSKDLKIIPIPPKLSSAIPQVLHKQQSVIVNHNSGKIRLAASSPSDQNLQIIPKPKFPSPAPRGFYGKPGGELDVPQEVTISRVPMKKEMVNTCVPTAPAIIQSKTTISAGPSLAHYRYPSSSTFSDVDVQCQPLNLGVKRTPVPVVAGLKKFIPDIKKIKKETLPCMLENNRSSSAINYDVRKIKKGPPPPYTEEVKDVKPLIADLHKVKTEPGFYSVDDGRPSSTTTSDLNRVPLIYKVLQQDNSAAESLLKFNQHPVHFQQAYINTVSPYIKIEPDSMDIEDLPAHVIKKTEPNSVSSAWSDFTFNGKIIKTEIKQEHMDVSEIAPKRSLSELKSLHLKKAWLQRHTTTEIKQPLSVGDNQILKKKQLETSKKKRVEDSDEMEEEDSETSSADSDTSTMSSNNSKDGKRIKKKQMRKKPVTIRRSQDEREMIAKYKKSGESFLQYRPCFEIIPRVQRCSECRWISHKRGQAIFCRFFHFRRLKYVNNGHQLVPDGFSDPNSNPNIDDLNIWMPDPENPPKNMNIRTSLFLLNKVGDQFCDLWRKDNTALDIDVSINKTIAWKKIVEGVREMCDVCATTIFNYHWTCIECGFCVCPDCYKDRKEDIRSSWSKVRKNRDEFSWQLCHKKVAHSQTQLMLTQIVAGKSLDILGQRIHEVRHIWQIEQSCNCDFSQKMISGGESFWKDLARSLLKEELQMDNVDSDAEEEIFDRKCQTDKETEPKSMNDSIKKNEESTKKYPNTPHSWLCEGRLLRLYDSKNPDNLKLFQQQWKRGQPVLVSDVTKHLNESLWHPDSFSKDFGNQTNDLVNCMNGKVVTGHPMKDFWDGFSSIAKRLVDSKTVPMLLKLKDWPPGDDFAEILPERYEDLMKSLPLSEYTHRTGQLNLASRLPKYFVPPDLGPKMYNAYGSALFHDKGTTNLHLDISDAVNVMVHVGIAEEDDKDEDYKRKAYQAIDEAGCDILMRRRVREKNELPGALWHIYSPKDTQKIRELLNRVTLEKGGKIHDNSDPIHDQVHYLDKKLRKRLYLEYGVSGYPIAQCLGDAVFIPAGAPHQVRNLHNCIKVAEDFVSPENIVHCFNLTHEFRNLSESHSNHEDKLQIKNIIYHTVKDATAYLTYVLNRRINEGSNLGGSSLGNNITTGGPKSYIGSQINLDLMTTSNGGTSNSSSSSSSNSSTNNINSNNNSNSKNITTV